MANCLRRDSKNLLYTQIFDLFTCISIKILKISGTITINNDY